MGTRKTHDLPAQLKNARRQFERWRRTRKVGTRVPEPLWKLAVKTAGTFGISRTARTLGVDYYNLKKRTEADSSLAVPDGAAAATFFELASPAGQVSVECIMDLEDPGGANMRIHLKGADVPDLSELSRSFWGG